MISAILYGRNDAHGYNLHKRAAISLNCIAEMLSAPDDEILFVDYNTPNDLPTFIEAIYDTLTPKAKSLLRVFRVRPELHRRMVARTHLAALEPHSRNIGIRRSNPANRWVLFTNTDMIFLTRGDVSSLTDAVRDLPDGQYILPRFELPEPLWESFPRTDPQAILSLCRESGTKMHLDEVAASHPYMRFDSPGDFQLVPRQALFDINGFDERMIHGWHADSNMCKRFFLLYGRRTESLAHRLKGYHCDHTRVATLAHRLDVKLENDLQEFVYGVEDPVARHQAASWGVPDEPIEELDFADGPAARFAVAVERALGEPQSAEYYSDANDQRNFVCYAPEHALAYLAGNLTVYPRHARFVYAGNNRRMLQLAARCIAEMGFLNPLSYVPQLLSGGPGPEPARAIEGTADAPGSALHAYLIANFDSLIFDFGLDATGRTPGRVARVTEWSREQRFSLGAVARCLERCAEESETVWRSQNCVPDFIVLNANHYVFMQFVGQFVLATDTPYNTHVRKGRPRVGEERLYRSHTWKHTEECMRSFFGYDTEDYSVPQIAPGDSIDLTSASRSDRYKSGHWGWMDLAGTWTDGPQAEIVFCPPSGWDDDLIVYVRITEAFIVDGDPIRVQVLLEGEQLARWSLPERYGIRRHRVMLPGRLLAGKLACRLAFCIENPQSAQLHHTLTGEQFIGNNDPRELGIKVQCITFTGTDRLLYALCKVLDFTEKGGGVFHIDEDWTQPDNLGTWTLGTDAHLVLYLSEPVETPVIAKFSVTDVAVNEAHPHLDVSVAFNGQTMAEWRLGPNRISSEQKVLVPAHILRLKEPLSISFHIAEPRSPMQLNWSDGDTRPLGFRLTAFRMDPVVTPKYRLGEVIDFTAGGNASSFLRADWTVPDRYGAWTVGPESTIAVRFEEPPTGDIPAAFVISDCMVSPDGAALPVVVKANGRIVGEWTLGPSRVPHIRSVNVPADVLEGAPELALAFAIANPRTPASLGWSDDPRPLGIRLARALFGPGDLLVPSFDDAGTGMAGLAAHVRNAIRTLVRELWTSPKGAV
jgi:hypothetical protein